MSPIDLIAYGLAGDLVLAVTGLIVVFIVVALRHR